MKVVINTQYKENYGSEAEPYWKFKGGEDYFLPLEGFNPDHEFAEKNLQMIVDSVRDQVEWSNEGSRSYIVGYEIVEDDYMTEFEKSQLEYDGEIRYPAKVLAEGVV